MYSAAAECRVVYLGFLHPPKNRMIGAFIYRLLNKENFIFPLVIGILEIIFGLILILEPTEHIAFHVIILGINMVLFSIKDPAPHKKELHQIVKEVL